MTSGTLRSILIVGAAFAALSVAACSKPAENTAANTSESDANAAMASSNSMSSNSTAMAANAASNDASATAPASNSGQ